MIPNKHHNFTGLSLENKLDCNVNGQTPSKLYIKLETHRIQIFMTTLSQTIRQSIIIGFQPAIIKAFITRVSSYLTAILTPKYHLT
ncbi:hypothetical protein Hanom_Chr08g00746611 [Helianthus anomalus]